MTQTSDRVVPGESELAALYALDSIRGFGPQKVKALYLAGINPSTVLEDPDALPIGGKRGAKFREELARLREEGLDEYVLRAKGQLEQAAAVGAHLLTYGDETYPRNVFESNNPIPILYVRGKLDVVRESSTVACVGSRNVAGRHADGHTAVARLAVDCGLTVVSGFALGADTLGHMAAFQQRGRTICVMPCGVDLAFPPENRDLWKQLLAYPDAAFVSEFPLSTRAAALTLRKRNKLIVAFSRGVFLSQSSVSGGAMNAYRFAVEQRKPVAVLESNDTEETSGNSAIAESQDGRTTVLRLDDLEEDAARWLRALS